MYLPPLTNTECCQLNWPPTQSKTVCQWLSCCHQHKARLCVSGCLVATNTKQDCVSVVVLLPPKQSKTVCQWLSCCHQHKARPCLWLSCCHQNKARPCVSGCLVATNTKQDRVCGCLVATNTKQDHVSGAVLLPAGYRLPQNSTPDSVYKLMLRCWEYMPEKRPHFKDIHESLQDALRQMN